MAKKMFISLAIVFLSLCCSVCFAADDNSNVNLGDEITDSLNKAGNSVRNVADDVMNGENNNTRDNNNNNNRNNNDNARTYTNGNGYNAVRTSVDDMATGNTTNMSATTWIWIILAVAAIIIVAMVWYYATQNNNKD